jgi:hypothetical protein
MMYSPKELGICLSEYRNNGVFQRRDNEWL